MLLTAVHTGLLVNDEYDVDGQQRESECGSSVTAEVAEVATGEAI